MSEMLDSVTQEIKIDDELNEVFSKKETESK